MLVIYFLEWKPVGRDVGLFVGMDVGEGVGDTRVKKFEIEYGISGLEKDALAFSLDSVFVLLLDFFFAKSYCVCNLLFGMEASGTEC